MYGRQSQLKMSPGEAKSDGSAPVFKDWRAGGGSTGGVSKGQSWQLPAPGSPFQVAPDKIDALSAHSPEFQKRVADDWAKGESWPHFPHKDDASAGFTGANYLKTRAFKVDD
jgi:hypothetical protein